MLFIAGGQLPQPSAQPFQYAPKSHGGQERGVHTWGQEGGQGSGAVDLTKHGMARMQCSVVGVGCPPPPRQRPRAPEPARRTRANAKETHAMHTHKHTQDRGEGA